jgi:hypothetical protein
VHFVNDIVSELKIMVPSHRGAEICTRAAKDRSGCIVLNGGANDNSHFTET